MQGTVLDGTNNFFSVECEDGVIRQCSLKGKKLKSVTEYYNPLAPGDVVSVEEDKLHTEMGQISELIPRRNAFVRWNVKGRCPQLLAANLDYLILVTTPDEPPFRPRFIDRELAQAEYEDLTPIIVCNKCDLETSGNPDFEHMLSIWEALGYKVLKVSAKNGNGIAELAHIIENKCCAFVGQSGIGKSSIINALDSTRTQRTGDLCSKYDRGSHTTTRGTLMKLHLNENLADGRSDAVASVIDTPGIRRFVLHNIPSNDLALYFREFKPLVGTCTFGMSCSHLTEPGCKILEAVYAGVITEERYESWKRISNEIRTGSWED